MRKTDIAISIKVDSLTKIDFSDMKFPMIVVYDHPVDFPDNIIARVWEASKKTPMNTVCLYETIDECRKDAKEAGFKIKIPRDAKDDPKIMETYLL